MNFNKRMLLLYAITDRRWTGKKSLYEQIEDALKGGVTIVQLREKDLPQDEFIREASKIKQLCHKYNVPLIINDDVDVAIKSGADGVHVGIKDAPVCEIRKRFGNNFIIGATCKTVAQAIEAEKSGADYMGVGAVFPSPTKKDAIRITKEELIDICSSVSIPAVAIGGITIDNLSEIKGTGVAGVAVISAIFAAEDIEIASSELKEKAKTVIGI